MDSCSSYENKKKLLFESLTSAESCIKGTSLEQTDRVSVHSTQTSPSKTVSRKFQGKESIFKRPEAPIQKCLRPRRQPDYQANPHKWKKYSLGHIDISDNTNTSAAFAFLKEIEKRKDGELAQYGDDEPMDTGDSNKIVFNRSAAKQNQQPTFRKSVALRKQIERDDDDDDFKDPVDQKAAFRGSKMMMPEYVIGQKMKKSKRLTSITSTSTDASSSISGTNSSSSSSSSSSGTKAKKPQLQHLFEEEDEE